MQDTANPTLSCSTLQPSVASLFPRGASSAFLADHRHDLFPDELFEDLFPSGRGRPSIPADVVASVMVLQALEGLSIGTRPGPSVTESAGRWPAGWSSMTRGSTSRSY